MYIQPGRPAFTGPRGGLVIIQSTGAVTTATHGYEEEHQLFVYIPLQLHVSYILKRIEVFFFLIVIVNNNDLSSFKKNISICYATPPMVGCLSGSCRHLIRLSWHFSINHSHSCVGNSLVRVTVRPRHKKWPRQGWNPGLLIKSPAHCSFGRWIPLPSYYSLIPY